MVNTLMFQWKSEWLYYGRRKMLRIVQDEIHPTMWRVELPDGSLTDMVNKTRAKDAASVLADRLLRNTRSPKAMVA